jgi:L-lactate dehydrogenase
MTSKIAIIGAGSVGGTSAYALLLGSVCCELLLVDTKVDVLDGQVRDLSDATCRENSSKCVRAGTYKEAGQCDIVVITTGSRRSIGKLSIAYSNHPGEVLMQPAGETTLELIYRSTAILHTVIDAMKPFRSDTILLLVSNPVDVLTSCAQELSGLPKSQVIGCGTFLDTVRLRGILAAKAGVRAFITFILQFSSSETNTI